jgi:hypothetical protein
LSNPQTLNLYAMVEDDPESFADLDGHVISGNPMNGYCNVANGTGSCDDDELGAIFNNRLSAAPLPPAPLAAFIDFLGQPDEPYAYDPLTFNPKSAKDRAQATAQQQELAANLAMALAGQGAGQCMHNACHALEKQKSTLEMEVNFSITLGNITLSTDKSISAAADISALGTSADLTVTDTSFDKDRPVGSLGAGIGKHLGLDLNFGQSPGGRIDGTGITLHVGVSTPTFPVHGSLNLHAPTDDFMWQLRSNPDFRSPLR